MNRAFVPIGIFVVIAAVLYVGVKHSPEKGSMRSALIGKPAPAFDLPILGEETRRLSTRELAGKPWVLNVWATWCVACRDEHATLLDISRENRVPIVGLDLRDKDEDARQWLQQLGNPYHLVAVDREGRTSIDFGVYGAPETFFIDAAGLVQYRHVGPMTREVWDREFVSRLGPGRP